MKRKIVGTVRKESDTESKPLSGKRFRVVLIREGLGNLQTCFYYTKEAILSAVSVFEGAQMYSDHPSRSEDFDRPERSVRDLVGHFENVTTELMEGSLCLVGDAVMLDGDNTEWAREAMKHAVGYSQKYPESSFIGLSINASGDAEEKSIDEVIKDASEGAMEKLVEAKASGIELVKVTSRITDCVSCDLVTRAGAGGKVLEMLESQGVVKMDQKQEETEVKQEEKQAEMPVDKAPADHPDAEQDKELIKSMLDKYLGEEKHGEEESESFKKIAKEYEAMGHSKEEACHAAGKHMKVQQSISDAGKTEPIKGEEKKDEEVKKEEEAKPEVKDEKSPEAKDDEEKKDDKKESDTIIKLNGRIAFLEAEIAKRDLEKHVESALSKTGLPRTVTTKFKQSVGDCKNIKEFDKNLKMFIEGFNSRESEISVEGSGEKALLVESESYNVGFGDCF